MSLLKVGTPSPDLESMKLPLNSAKSQRWRIGLVCSSMLDPIIQSSKSNILTEGTRYVVKSLGSKYGITPCFMAKPKEGLPGNSGHMHSMISFFIINHIFYTIKRLWARYKTGVEIGAKIVFFQYLLSTQMEIISLPGLSPIQPLYTPIWYICQISDGISLRVC